MPVLHGGHQKTGLGEDTLQQAAHLRLIFRDEDVRGHFEGIGDGGRVRSILARRTRLGKPDHDRGAFVRCAADVDMSAVVLHRAVHHGEPEPRALSHALGGEERFEDALEHIGRHAVPSVAHLQSHPRSRWWQIGSRLLLDVDIVEFDREQTAIGHRVARIHREIHDGLFDAAGIHTHQLVTGCAHVDGDRGRHHPDQQRGRALHDGIEPLRSIAQRRAAREVEQLSRERSRTTGRCLDGLQFGPRRMVQRQLTRARDRHCPRWP